MSIKYRPCTYNPWLYLILHTQMHLRQSDNDVCTVLNINTTNWRPIQNLRLVLGNVKVSVGPFRYFSLNFSFSSALNEDIYGAAAESQRAAAAVFPAKGSWRCHGVIANMLIQNEQTGTHHRHLKEAFTSEWTAWSTL